MNETKEQLFELLIKTLFDEYKIGPNSAKALIADNIEIFNSYLTHGKDSLYATAMLLDWQRNYREQNQVS